MENPTKNEQLLADLINQPVAAPAVSPPTDHQQTITQQRPRATNRTVGGLYDKLGLTLALIASLAVAAFIWYAGAYFTLWFLERAGLALAGAGHAKWVIPAAITAGQLWLWPRANSPWQSMLVFLGFLAFDVGTSWGGFTNWAAGRRVEMFSGFTIPNQGMWLHGLALICGLGFAFLPEKIARWALSELRRTWR